MDSGEWAGVRTRTDLAKYARKAAMRRARRRAASIVGKERRWEWAGGGLAVFEVGVCEMTGALSTE